MALTTTVAALIFGVLCFAMGLAAYIAAPWYIAPVLPSPLRKKLAKQYWWASMKARGRTLVTLIGRELVALPSKRAAEYGGEEVTVDGERRVYLDPDDRMTASYRERLGLALDDPGVIVDQRVAAIGRELTAAKDAGRIAYWTQDDRQLPAFMERFLAIPRAARGVSLSLAKRAIGGPADGGVADMSEEFTSHSLEGHEESNVLPLETKPMIAFIIAFLIVFVTMNTLGGGGGGGIGGVLP